MSPLLTANLAQTTSYSSSINLSFYKINVFLRILGFTKLAYNSWKEPAGYRDRSEHLERADLDTYIDFISPIYTYAQ